MICVDSMWSCAPNSGWQWHESCHLFDTAGDTEALHEFASDLGLEQRWFQDTVDFPHYDLTRSKRELAVRSGAKEVSRRVMVSLIRRKGK